MAEPTYFPVLKDKQGERWALGNLDPATKAAIAPVLQLWPATPPVTIRQHIAEVSRRWANAGPLLIDSSWVIPIAGQAHPLAVASAEAAANGLPVIPVVRDGSDADALAAARAVAGSHHRGAAIRLAAAAWPGSGAVAVVPQLLRDLSLMAGEVDLLLDAGPVGNPRALDLYRIVLQESLPRFPLLAEWRRIAVLGGAFPVDLRGIVAGSVVRIPRFDWQLWQLRPNVGREVGHGDYGVAHPDPVEDVSAPRAIPIYAQLRYTVEDAFAVTKGGDIRRAGASEAHAVAQRIARLPEFSGAAFSTGDQWIAERARGLGTSGNYTKWREVATVHHITLVQQQVATALAASMHP